MAIKERIETTIKVETFVSKRDIVRFDRQQIVQHILLMLSFTLLAITGLPMRFHNASISQWWIGVWGGIDTVRSVHHSAAWIMVICCVYHLIYLGITIFVLKRPFPWKMLPALKDFKDLGQELGHFLGIRKQRPAFDRFNWREKFDYWAVFWGMFIMAGSGFVLMYPVFVTRFLPGWVVPIALVAHSDEAVLAVSWIVLVHLTFNHLSPGIFPLNKSIFTGKVPRERYQREHPAEYARLAEDDREREP